MASSGSDPAPTITGFEVGTWEDSSNVSTEELTSEDRELWGKRGHFDFLSFTGFGEAPEGDPTLLRVSVLFECFKLKIPLSLSMLTE